MFCVVDRRSLCLRCGVVGVHVSFGVGEMVCYHVVGAIMTMIPHDVGLVVSVVVFHLGVGHGLLLLSALVFVYTRHSEFPCFVQRCLVLCFVFAVVMCCVMLLVGIREFS